MREEKLRSAKEILDPESRVSQAFNEAGIETESIPEEIMRRLWVLERSTKFFSHSQRMVEICNLLFEGLKIDSDFKSLSLESSDKKSLNLAALVHDIGKTGPPEATTQEQQRTAIDIYGIQDVKNHHTNSLRQVVSERRSAELALSHRLEEFCDTFKIPKDNPIVVYYNTHTEWSVGILQKFPDFFNTDVVNMVSAHHADLPKKVTDPSWKHKNFGGVEANNPDFKTALMARILMVADKIEAASARKSRESHKFLDANQVYAWIKNNLRTNFPNDIICTKLLAILKSKIKDNKFEF